MNTALQSHMTIITIFGVVGFIAGYIWLGFKLSSVAENKYYYGIWNFVTIPSMIYIAWVWVAFCFRTDGFKPELITSQDNFIMLLSTAAVFIIAWIYSSVKTSFWFGLFVTLYQASISYITFLITMAIIMGFFGGGSSDKK